MEICKKYGFVGEPCHDYIIYFAAIIQNLGKKVLVIDHTKNSSVMNTIIKSDEPLEEVQYKNIDYMFGKYEDIVTVEYDVIFYALSDLYYEKSSNHIISNNNLISNIDEFFVITTMEKNSIMKCAQIVEHILEQMEIPVHIIYRDTCESKINQQYFISNFMSQRGAESKSYQVPLDIIDFEYRIRMDYEPYKEFKNLSKPYVSCLIEISKYLFCTTNKEIEKAYKKAKRGVTYFESSVLE